MRKGSVVLVFLLWAPVVGWADNRNGATGADGAYYQADAQPGGNVKIIRNGNVTAAQPGANIFVQSNPAMTRVGSTLYVIARSTNNNRIYCTRSSSPYTSWTPWVYVNGQTLDAPALVSNTAGNQAWAFVRGTNNVLYSANLINCPPAGGWSATISSSGQFIFMQAAPSAVSDPSGVYVAYLGADNEFHRWKLGTSSFPVARGFGSDQDATGGALYAHLNNEEAGSLFLPAGYAPPFTHRAVAISPANALSTAPSGCPANTPPFLAMGGPLTFMCYVKDNATGDFVIRNQMNAGGTPGLPYQYNWRSCMIGNSFGFFSDDCDFGAAVSFFRDIVSPSQINLRAWVSASGSPATQAGFVSLVFRLKNKLLLGEEIELHFIPYWYAQSGCYEINGGHDGHGRHVFAFTPACVGASNLGSGQSRFYNVNLKSYILMRFSDFFRGFHQDIDPVASNWAVNPTLFFLFVWSRSLFSHRPVCPSPKGSLVRSQIIVPPSPSVHSPPTDNTLQQSPLSAGHLRR